MIARNSQPGLFATNPRINGITDYIRSDKFDPTTFGEIYNQTDFNDNEKAAIGSALFLKAKSMRNDVAAIGSIAFIYVETVKEKTPWWDLKTKNKTSNAEKKLKTVCNKQNATMHSILQLAIDYGNEEAKLYKLKNNINSQNVRAFKQ